MSVRSLLSVSIFASSVSMRPLSRHQIAPRLPKTTTNGAISVQFTSPGYTGVAHGSSQPSEGRGNPSRSRPPSALLRTGFDKLRTGLQGGDRNVGSPSLGVGATGRSPLPARKGKDRQARCLRSQGGRTGAFLSPPWRGAAKQRGGFPLPRGGGEGQKKTAIPHVRLHLMDIGLNPLKALVCIHYD